MSPSQQNSVDTHVVFGQKHRTVKKVPSKYVSKMIVLVKVLVKIRSKEFLIKTRYKHVEMTTDNCHRDILSSQKKVKHQRY